jgi:SHS2 domain-containing protein
MRGKMQILEQVEKEVNVEGDNLENLLYNFLEEFLFLLDSEDFLVSEIKNLEIDEKNNKLKMVLLGDVAKNYHFTNDVKAITYSEMRIERGEEVVITGVFDV